MKISELIATLQLELLTASAYEDREIKGCYVGDLLSWVMGRAKSQDVWITVMSNINIVAVASLTDAACILIAENVSVEENVLEKADAQNVVIVRSPLSGYELSVKVHEAIDA